MIIPLMSKTVTLPWLVFFFNCMCNLKSVCFKEPLLSSYKGKYTADVKDYEIVIPQRVNSDGTFISHLVSHHHSKRSIKELDFIFYKIPIEGEDYLIELTPNLNLISPGAVVEIHKDDVKFPNQTTFNESSSSKKLGKLFKNLDIKKLENTKCHFSGHVKGENISKAALSTCYGLAGFIQIMKGFYTIEPVAEHDPFLEDAYPHVLYKADGLENSSICHTLGELKASLADRMVRKRRDSNLGLSLPLYIETLIVMDKALISHHQDSDCENYVLTVFNMAFNLFQDTSSGLTMTLTIVKMIRLEVENDEMNLKLNADAEKTLRYFQTWQYEINPGDDSHPNHHDIAVLITRVNICYTPSACGLLGLTTVGKACDPKLSAALCEDDGLRLGYIIAHEIGHLLGADHDAENSTCDGIDADGLKTIMHPSISMTAQTWSACSQAHFKAFFRSGMGSCFLDEPEEHHFNVQDLLPGVMYDADFQCKHLISVNAQECDMGSTCDSLNCYVPGYACILTRTPPADGTRCGENMWCLGTKCLVIGQRPGAIDGNWGEWSAWGDCSRTCGSGVTSSVRNCDKPQPSHGGKHCVGERKRDVQCREFDDWVYPEDGQIHTWKAHFFHDGNPCVLYCINEKNEVAALRPRVIDGTMCFRGIRDICVAGTCKSLPCDLLFESDAVEDSCGVCHGDGTGCEFSEGMETFSKLEKGFTKLVNIPAGTRNVKVEETSPTLANIVVRDADSKDTYVRGNSLGMFSVPGSSAWLGMIKKNQESLNIPGPVTKPLSVWIRRVDNVTVKWSMALPAEQQRKGEYAWDFLKWGPCSAVCGRGTQVSEPSCMEGKAGLVEDTFCADLEKPPTKVRQCQLAECEPRWMVGDWKACESDSLKKERQRMVYCIKSLGEEEGESQIVPDLECPEPKPHSKELCEKRRKREDADYEIDEGCLETKPTFISDTSKYGFGKRYEDYLKHFAALPVPQANCETISLHLVSPPHFKHYLHVLETPKEFQVGSDSRSGSDKNLPGKTSRDTPAPTTASPKLYEETFSISRVHSAEENRTKKSQSRAPQRHRETAMVEKFNLSPEYTYKKSNLKQPNTSSGKAEFYRTRIPGRERLNSSLKGNRNVRCIFLGRRKGKNFHFRPSNRPNAIEKIKPSLKRTNRRNNRRKAPNPKFPFRERNGHLSLSKNRSTSSDLMETVHAFVELENRKVYGRRPRRYSPLNRKVREGLTNYHPRKPSGEEKSPGAILHSDGFEPKSGEGFKESLLNAEDSFSSRSKSHRHAQKRNTKSARSPGEVKVQKKKRSSRKRKKSKSKDANLKQGKEQGSSGCGTETRNYLNSLFRDSHPSVPNKEPKSKCENVIIKEGLLVIDKDLAKNQKVEILFDGDEASERQKKHENLLRPTRNERKLTVEGQAVFDLFRELQEPTQEKHNLNNKSQGSIEINEEANSGRETEEPYGSKAKTTEQTKDEVQTPDESVNKASHPTTPTNTEGDYYPEELERGDGYWKESSTKALETELN